MMMDSNVVTNANLKTCLTTGGFENQNHLKMKKANSKIRNQCSNFQIGSFLKYVTYPFGFFMMA